MCERELKKEWAEVSQVIDSALAEWLTESQQAETEAEIRAQREWEKSETEWERGRELSLVCLCEVSLQ